MQQTATGGIVLTYRCFILDRESQITERLEIKCEDDRKAIAEARAFLEHRPDMIAIEVWDGARLVQKLRQVSPARNALS